MPGDQVRQSGKSVAPKGRIVEGKDRIGEVVEGNINLCLANERY